jgi:hypothetical protein
MRPTAFICGPYHDSEPRQINKNIEAAKEASVWLWNNGYYVFCPHMNTANFHILTHQPESVYKQFAFRVIRSGLIDLLVLIFRWKFSEGAHNELQLCRTLEIPVLEFTNNQLIELI